MSLFHHVPGLDRQTPLALILIAALAALEAIGGFIEELTGEAVPPAVRAGTAMVVAVAAFLLVWLDHESPRAAVEHSEGT